MIVDAHTHYSQPHSDERPYDQEMVAANPNIRFTKVVSVEEMIAKMPVLGLDRIVQVTQSKMGYDNRYAIEGALRYPDKILGVIGRFDPMAPDLESRLRKYYSNPVMLGVRFTLFTPTQRAWLRDGGLDPFLGAAEKLNVPVQIYAPDQLKESLAAARRFPGVRFLFDHMGIDNAHLRPHEETFADWAELIELAREPNIWMKVSYFAEASQASEKYPFPRAQQRFRELYEGAGASRMIWGSNFPPVESVKACTHLETINFIRDHCDFLSAVDRAAILGKNFLDQFTRKPV